MPNSDKDSARLFLQSLYKAEIDILPDYENKILNIRVHNLNNNANDNYARYLFKVLNESETIFPNTDLKLVYNLVSDFFPLS